MCNVLQHQHPHNEVSILYTFVLPCLPLDNHVSDEADHPQDHTADEAPDEPPDELPVDVDDVFGSVGQRVLLGRVEGRASSLRNFGVDGLGVGVSNREPSTEAGEGGQPHKEYEVPSDVSRLFTKWPM